MHNYKQRLKNLLLENQDKITTKTEKEIQVRIHQESEIICFTHEFGLWFLKSKFAALQKS